MKAYPDTSFLFSLYVPQAHSHRAAAYFSAMSEPLHLTSLNRFELVNAIQLSLFRGAIMHDAGLGALEKLAANIAAGALVVVACDWAAVHARALKISMLHTHRRGDRGLDILHVATALELRARDFLTFDGRQGALAEVTGLKVRP